MAVVGSGTARFTTHASDWLYCVVFHGPDADKHEDHELLTAEGAIYYATIWNKFSVLGENPTWAEPISYEDLKERYEFENERRRTNEAVDDRLAEIEAAKPKRGAVRQLLTRATAMIG